MSVFINDGGVEKEAKMIYVNDGGVDKLVSGGGQEFDRGEVWGAMLSGGGAFRAMAEGNGVVVAVGDGGRIVSSTDGGITWRNRDSGTSNNLNDVTRGKGVFVAVGSGGVILTSPDGEIWTGRTSGTTSNFFGVAFGLDIFAASGPVGNIFTSPTGTAWTPRPTGTSLANTKIGFGDGKFLARRNSANSLLRSINGIDWSQITASGLPSSNSRIEHADDVGLWFTGSTTSGSAGIYSSVDGEGWTRRTNKASFSTRFRDGIGVSVGSSGGIMLSLDGMSWEDAYSSGAFSGDSYDVLLGKKMLICGGDGRILTSIKTVWG